MKKVLMKICFLMLAVMCVLPFSAAGAEKRTLAVMPLENVSGLYEYRVADIMTEQLVGALYTSGRFNLVERNQMAGALREVGFDMSGAVDMNTAVEAGRMLGAKASLIGKVTAATVYGNPNAKLVNRGSIFDNFVKPYQGKVAVELRIIDNATGQLLSLVSVEGSSSGKNQEEALYRSCKEAAGRFLEQIVDKYVGTVIDVEGDTVYIDAGSSAGVKKGDTYEIVKEGNPLMKDGRIIAIKYIPVGKLKVVEVEAEHSVCKVVDHAGGMPVTNGNIVRRVKK